jgi:hypothetical protein
MGIWEILSLMFLYRIVVAWIQYEKDTFVILKVSFSVVMIAFFNKTGDEFGHEQFMLPFLNLS